MSQPLDIKVEIQAAWVWAVVSYSADNAAPVVLGQSSEAFPTEEAARVDAARALPGLSANSSI